MIKTIVIIEDNPLNLKLFIETLKTIPNVQIFSETRGDEGFELLKKIQADVVILDIQLPGMSGQEICINLKRMKEYKNSTIIAVTASNLKYTNLENDNAGFNKIIAKPIDVLKFRREIARIINNK